MSKEKSAITCNSAVTWIVFCKAPMFDGSTHGVTYLQQFEAAACLNKWSEEEKRLSLIHALKVPVAELLQKISPEARILAALEL